LSWPPDRANRFEDFGDARGRDSPKRSGLIDTHFAGDKVGPMPEEKGTRAVSRYETVIATFVGLLAVCVAAYTAYMQRQQVRAAVWPILEFDTANQPEIHLTLSNKGVGPAIIRHVVVKVDGQPVRNWNEALEKMLGPGKHNFSESDMHDHVLSAGESMTVFTPRNPENNPLAYDRSNPLWIEMNEQRKRISVEICYGSTLGECWALRADASTSSTTTETRRCPTPSEISFQQ
jgi:hypothetical protein